MDGETTEGAIARTMTIARQIIDAYGVTAAALQRIERALRELAAAGALVERVELQRLHSGRAAATVLASEGIDGLTLVLARFGPEAPTPVHDHGTWGVACVVAGKDRYLRWERAEDGRESEPARVHIRDERILAPGDTVSWLEPPHDIHSQQGYGEAAWEIVLFGRDALRLDRHYFNAETGRVHVARATVE